MVVGSNRHYFGSSASARCTCLCLRLLAGGMTYKVYKVSYLTSRGTYREYWGHTRCVDVRKHWHSKKPPAWMKPRKTALNFEVVEVGLNTKEDALAAEAFFLGSSQFPAPRSETNRDLRHRRETTFDVSQPASADRQAEHRRSLDARSWLLQHRPKHLT